MATAPEPLNVVATARYGKDAKRVRKRGKDMSRILEVVDALRRPPTAGRSAS